MQPHPFHMGAGDLSSGPYACMVSTLLTEPSLQHLVSCFFGEKFAEFCKLLLLLAIYLSWT